MATVLYGCDMDHYGKKRIIGAFRENHQQAHGGNSSSPQHPTPHGGNKG